MKAYEVKVKFSQQLVRKVHKLLVKAHNETHARLLAQERARSENDGACNVKALAVKQLSIQELTYLVGGNPYTKHPLPVQRWKLTDACVAKGVI